MPESVEVVIHVDTSVDVPLGQPGTPGAAGAQGTQGIQGIPGTDGADGAAGVGVPTGGTEGQVLAKVSSDDYDTEWVDQTGGGGGGGTWGSITGTLADQTDLDAALDAKSDEGHSHAQSDVTGLTAALAGKSDTGHTHAQSDVTGLTAALAAKADDAATTTALAGKAATSHTHTASNVTDFNTAADARVVAGITGKLDTSAAPELIRDTMGTALTAGSGITITPNDGSDIITIAATGASGSGNATARDALYGVPANDAARSALANQAPVWFNTDKGWYETYYATTGTSGLTVTGLLSGHSAGWYPRAGSLLIVHRGKASAQQLLVAGAVTDPTLAASQVSIGGYVDSGVSGVTVPFGGHYRLFGSIFYTGVSSSFCVCYLYVNGSSMGSNIAQKGPADVEAAATATVPVVAGQVVKIVALSQAATSVLGSTAYEGARLEVQYLGPPLVNG